MKNGPIISIHGSTIKLTLLKFTLMHLTILFDHLSHSSISATVDGSHFLIIFDTKIDAFIVQQYLKNIQIAKFGSIVNGCTKINIECIEICFVL